MDLAAAAHLLTERPPSIHRFELASQIRKSATSIPSNIAEGHAQRGDSVFLRHIRIALGSLAELETQIDGADSRAANRELRTASRKVNVFSLRFFRAVAFDRESLRVRPSRARGRQLHPVVRGRQFCTGLDSRLCFDSSGTSAYDSLQACCQQTFTSLRTFEVANFRTSELPNFPASRFRQL
jgi:four helix bundle protein